MRVETRNMIATHAEMNFQELTNTAQFRSHYFTIITQLSQFPRTSRVEIRDSLKGRHRVRKGWEKASKTDAVRLYSDHQGQET